MSETQPAQSAQFRPWQTIWFHPRQTIQQIIDVNPWYWIYILVPLSRIAYGIGSWLNAVFMDSDDFRENLLLAMGHSLVVGTAGAFVGCLVLQWIMARRGNRIPYSHFAAAIYWATVPEIGFLLLFIVVLVCVPLVSILLPAAGAISTRLDLLLLFAWVLAGIWSTVLNLGALAQVLRCSVMAAIGWSLVTGMILAPPAWALYRLSSRFLDRYSGDIVIYQRPGTETGPNLTSVAVPVAVLVLSAAVLLAMYRASRPESLAAPPGGKHEQDL